MVHSFYVLPATISRSLQGLVVVSTIHLLYSLFKFKVTQIEIGKLLHSGDKKSNYHWIEFGFYILLMINGSTTSAFVVCILVFEILSLLEPANHFDWYVLK